MQIQLCMYLIHFVHMRYELGYILCMSVCICLLYELQITSMDQAPQGGIQQQPTQRGRLPPLYPRGGGGLVYGRRSDGSGPTGLRMGLVKRAELKLVVSQ